MSFSKQERRQSGFSYKRYKSPEFINLATLTNFILLASFFSPWKYQGASGLQGIEKETRGVEWVDPLTHCQ